MILGTGKVRVERSEWREVKEHEAAAASGQDHLPGCVIGQ